MEDQLYYYILFRHIHYWIIWIPFLIRYQYCSRCLSLLPQTNGSNNQSILNILTRHKCVRTSIFGCKISKCFEDNFMEHVCSLDRLINPKKRCIFVWDFQMISLASSKGKLTLKGQQMQASMAALVT